MKSEKYQGRLKVCKVDVDQAFTAASNYKIMSIPALAVFKNGEVVDRVAGVLPKAGLEVLIKTHI
ncbi:MAG: thioredoxin domain-containing protein [Candidatus Kaelpia imicola]|nr:thioredoxin domain-containing protein [Candidatus Kaelpia imicola]